ncbi:ABC transporter permease [Alphaproteobacteria bacterium]|jgi:peptide/nickel transport system permease protein|nr:ABC transporter permease [Alphaproteobacteria bacterium]|tara:strand:+ start:516 stop:1406 length:891 start_codon:yes stop_codon:yes gene_type:complete
MSEVPLNIQKRRTVLDFIIQQPLGFIGLIMIIIMFTAAIFAPHVAPFNPEDVDFEASPALGGGQPSWEHLLGADAFGRDILSRLIYGARTALSIGFLSAMLGCTVGAIIGTTSAFYGGKVDLLIQRFIDLMLSFPIVVLAIVVIAIFPKTVVVGIDINVIIAIAIPFTPKVARVIRAQALTIVTLPYIDAAKASGYSASRIIFRHILPNVSAPFLIMLTAFIGQAILLEASLSYLGLGVVEPTPSWGLMLSGVNSDYYRTAAWMIIYPGLAVSIAVFSFNLLGDSLRDWLDPKLKL